jgi:hypothetical protein
MNTQTVKLQTVLRAALFAVMTVGSMSLGLGLTTYTIAKANDYVLTSINGDAPGLGNEPAACLYD